MLKVVLGLAISVLSAGGCATVWTSDVKNLADTPSGVRVYAPRVYLMVDAAKAKSTIFVAPDFRRAYDVKPITVFAKQDFTIELNDGVLSKLTANQDTTAFLTFFKEAAQLAAKGAGLPVSQNTIDGSFGLKSGIYEVTDDGRIMPVTVP
jgi:hypothetical protein